MTEQTTEEVEQDSAVAGPPGKAETVPPPPQRGPGGGACPILGRKTWRESAKQFNSRVSNTLMHVGGEFLDYSGGAYHSLEDATMRAKARFFLDHSVVCVMNAETGKFQRYEKFNPERKHVSELVSVLEDLNHVAQESITPSPCWLSNDPNLPPPRECVSLRNGILHLPTLDLAPPSPQFFTRCALPFDFDPSATCPRWLQALQEWWPNSPDEPHLLQEIFGYLVSGRTDLHKLFAYVGRGRNGKGTIFSVIAMLLGNDNVVPMTAKSLTAQFGTEALIAKSACVLNEFGFGQKDDRVGITNFIKSVVGGDKVDIPRKYRDAWEGHLGVRFNLSCNAIPNFADDSPAFRDRLIVLRMGQRFDDADGHKPDRQLSAKLQQEVSGIFNWSLAGLRRLTEQGEFTMTASTKEERNKFARAASPIRTFVEDTCEVVDDRKEHVDAEVLYQRYVNWCGRNGSRPAPKTKFIETVEMFDARIKYQRPQAESPGAKRVFVFSGLRLTSGPGEPQGEAEAEAMAEARRDELPFG
jgi:putative DNA primase/helicase